LREVIDNSGRHLLDIAKIKQMFIENCLSYTLRRPDFIAELARIEYANARRDAMRGETMPLDYLTTEINRITGLRLLPLYPPLQDQVTKILPKMTHNDSLVKEVYEECPICYTDMTSDSMVQLGCSHSFCGDCIVGQIKSSKKSTADCAMCRSTISECSSASANLLQKITSSI
jgi:hypothetical protein